MPRYILKLHDDKFGKDYYMEWSTIVDAPVTYGVSLKEFKEYYQAEYGNEGMKELDNRMKRVEAKGTSSLIDDSGDDLIMHNRAGEDEVSLTKEELLEVFCRKYNS